MINELCFVAKGRAERSLNFKMKRFDVLKPMHVLWFRGVAILLKQNPGKRACPGYGYEVQFYAFKAT